MLENFQNKIFVFIRMRRKDDRQEKLNEIKEMMAKIKIEKMTILEHQVKRIIKIFFSI